MKLMISLSARASADSIVSLTAEKKKLEKQLLSIDAKISKLQDKEVKAMLPKKGYYQVTQKYPVADGPTRSSRLLVKVTSVAKDTIACITSDGRKTSFTAQSWMSGRAKPITKEDFDAAAPKQAAAPAIKVSAAARKATSQYKFARKIGEFVSKKHYSRVEQAIADASQSARAPVVALLGNRATVIGTWTKTTGFTWASSAARKKFTGA